MSLYEVLVPGEGTGREALAETVFIRDRFSWGAALLPPVWALVHGLWFELLLWVIATIALAAASLVLGGEAVFYLYVLLALLIGCEGSAIYVAALRRRGFRTVGDLIAPSLDMAEMEWLKRGSTA